MSGKICLLQDDGNPQSLTEHPYDREDLLGGLLGRNPDLLASDQIDEAAPRRWLLISREWGDSSETGFLFGGFWLCPCTRPAYPAHARRGPVGRRELHTGVGQGQVCEVQRTNGRCVAPVARMEGAHGRAPVQGFGGQDGPVHIAARVGMTREVACRFLHRFADEGLIDITRSEFVVHGQ